MASVFTLFGELLADTKSFQNSLMAAERRLGSVESEIASAEQKAKELGNTTNTTARSFEKLREKVAESERRMSAAIDSFNRGDISAKKFASAVESTNRAFSSASSRAKDMSARIEDAANKSNTFSKKMSSSVTAGNLLAGALSSVVDRAADFAIQGVKLNATLDKLVRFTSTLDKNFQNPVALKRFTDGIKQLATEIPQSAESIAKASFTIKSAFGDLNEKQTLDFLKQFGLAATASNTDIATHAENIAALAKQYKITSEQLPKFNALIASSFGQALASDSQVAQGFNKVLNGAIAVKQPLETVIAAMSTLQGSSNDAAANTTMLGNVFAKMTDGKYQEGFKEIGASVFDAKGNFRDLKDIVADASKAMQGLSDRQISEKFAFLKDKEVREGFLTLLKNKKAFDEQLANGAGIEAFQQKTNVMLESTESRWNKFYSNITNLQSGAGGKISDFFLEAFDSTTVTGGIVIFFNNVGDAVIKGILYLAEATIAPINSLSETIVAAILGDDFAAKMKENTTKFYDGARERISEQTAKNTRMILQNQKDSWQKIADGTADPEAKATALKNIENLNRAIQGSLNKSSVELYQSYKDLSESAIKGLSSSNEKMKAQGQQTAQTLVDAINQALKNPNLDSGIADEFRKLLEELKKTAQQYGVTLQNVAFRLGSNVGQGLIGGLNSQRGAVVAAAANLANAATLSAKSELMIASPSKVFFGIGKDTAQGFVDGINSLKASAQSAMASVLDISGLKLGKGDKAGVELLTNYISELSKLNVTTKEQETILELTAGKYSKLNAQIRERILNAAQEIDAANKFKSSYDQIASAFEKLSESVARPQTELEKINAILTSATNAAAIAAYAKSIGLTVTQFEALARIKAMLADRTDSEDGLSTGRAEGGEGKGWNDPNAPIVKTIEQLGPPPPLVKAWDNFFGTFFQRIDEIKQKLPPIKVLIGETLVDSISNIGDIFANAVQQWDGTIGGFFKSIASGFGEMAKQIIADLIRIMIYKAIMKIVGAFAGGGSGGSIGGGDFGGGNGLGGDIFGAAGGGMVSGAGTATSDSIWARLSNGEFVMKAKAVSHFGAGFFARLNNLSLPKPAFASGGLVSPSMITPVSNYSSAPQSATHNYNLPPVTINGAKDPQATGQSVKQAMREMIGKMQHEQSRNK